MQRARALVFPSRWYETLGLVVVEAAAQGLPAVVADSSAASRFLEHDRTGLHFRTGSLESLMEQLQRLRDDEFADRLGQAAYNWYWQRPWTMSAHLDALKDYLRADALHRTGEENVMLNAPATGPLCVLLVVEPGRDGVFRHVELLAHYLVEQAGMKVHLAYSSVRGSPDLDELVRFLESTTAHARSTCARPTPRARRTPSGFLRLRRLAMAVRPDVIHAHSSKAGALARTLAWTGIEARYFYTPNAYYQMYGPDTLAKRAFMTVERLLARTGTTMHVSASEADYARRLLGVQPAQQQAIVNSVDGDRYRPAARPGRKARAAPPVSPASGGVGLRHHRPVQRAERPAHAVPCRPRGPRRKIPASALHTWARGIYCPRSPGCSTTHRRG